jgi:hypothetical protein
MTAVGNVDTRASRVAIARSIAFDDAYPFGHFDAGRFRGPVCNVVHTHAKRLGLKAADFGGHSPRVGFLISAARRGCFAAGAQARAVRHALRRAGSNPRG